MQYTLNSGGCATVSVSDILANLRQHDAWLHHARLLRDALIKWQCNHPGFSAEWSGLAQVDRDIAELQTGRDFWQAQAAALHPAPNNRFAARVNVSAHLSNHVGGAAR